MKTPLKFNTATNLSNYGCSVIESIENLPKFGWDFIQRKGIKLIVVKQRKRGLTSSGLPSTCHGSVSLLVKQYGGFQLSGYRCNGFSKKAVEFIYHSVWVTPEGVAVEVLESSLPTNVKSFTLFIPLQKNPWFKETTPIFGDFVITPSKETSWFNMEHQGKYRRMTETKSLSIYESKEYDLFEMANMEETFLEGGFTKPSLLTGKTWEEIQQSSK